MKLKVKWYRPKPIETFLSFFVGWVIDRRALQFYRRGFRQLAIFSHDYVGNRINIDGVYDLEELNMVFYWLVENRVEMDNSVAIEIGANIGNHSLFFSDYFSEVHAFEPNPRTFELLSINCRQKNIICHMVGLAAKQAESFIVEYPPNIGGSKVNQNEHDRNDLSPRRKITLDVLDNVTSEIKNILLLKIDVEGFELEVLKGAENVFKKTFSNHFV